MKKLREAVKLAEAADDLDDFIIDWAGDNDSAVDVWGDEDTHKKLKALVDKKAKIKSIMVDESDAYEKLQDKIQKLKQQGWKLLGDTDNYDSAEAIMYR